MKKSLVTIIALLMVAFANLPLSAQSLKSLNADVKFGRNPVKYAGTAAYTDGRGVWLEWKTESESKNLGFFVYRVVNGVKEIVSPALITGANLQALGDRITAGSYSFFDRFGDLNSVYIIESLNANGQRHDSRLIQTQFVENLTSVAGLSSEQLENQAKNASPVLLGSESVLPEDLAAEVDANTLDANPQTQQWVAAQPGVKIGVKTEGLYRVSRASLQASGFDVSAPINLWQLYANGIEQPIIVGNNGDYIEFYGKGIDTLDSDTQTYFLIVGTGNGKRINSTFRRRVGGTEISSSYAQSFVKKERFSYSSNFLNGDAENFFGSVATNSGGLIFFVLTGVDFSVPNSSVELTVQGLTEVPHQTKITLNNTDLGVISNNNYNSTTQSFTVPTSLLREGVNELQIKTLNGSGDVTAFGGIKVNFARRYQADQNRFSFHVPNFKATYAEKFSSSNIRVFDTTNPNNPLLITGLNIEPSGSAFRVLLPSNRGRVMFAVEESAVMQPASIVQNIPSTLSTAANSGGLIIITYKDWLAEAEEWANYRRAQGAVVKVVNVEDIFDEFNYGILKPDAVRDFLQYAKNNWQTPPNYVLLMGDATYDPRNYLGTNNFNFVPTRLVDTIYTETGSDDTLADFNNDGLSEIPIGRIPARNAATVSLALNKTMNFEQGAAQAINRGVLFASDLPNGYDFEGLSLRLANQLPGNVPKVFVNRALADANAQLVNQMNTGRYIANYSGHGSATFWAAAGFFGSTHASQLTNSNNLSVFTMLTCLNGYFIQPNDSLSEFLLKNPNGGAVATWASSGLTTPDIQEIMATRFFNQVGTGNIPRLGDLIRDAKTTINFGRDVRLSWVLLGDPMLKVR